MFLNNCSGSNGEVDLGVIRSGAKGNNWEDIAVIKKKAVRKNCGGKDVGMNMSCIEKNRSNFNTK